MEIKSYKDFEKNAAANTLKSPIIIFGEENYLIKQCIKKVYSRVISFPELNIVTMEGVNITVDSITKSLSLKQSFSASRRAFSYRFPASELGFTRVVTAM
jgi:hypothetical protein